MNKKIFLLVAILCLCMLFASCGSEETDSTLVMENWNGTYVWEDEETQEFKVLTIEHRGENVIHIDAESAKKEECFDGEAKSQTGRYLAVNLGSKSLKVTLAANYSYVEIDDMWTATNPDDRVENWSGRYLKLEEGMEIPKFGTSSWNGKYICEENGQIVSVYGIRERYVLFTYKSLEGEEEVENRLVCLESDPTRAVYTKDERLVMIDIVKANEKLEIKDMYMNDMENTGISGIYKKYIPENTNEQ